MQAIQYTATARWLHWIVAGLIVVQYTLAELAESAAEHNAAMAQLALLAQHKSFGITILVLAVIRLVWRWLHRAPTLPAGLPGWQINAAKLGHWGLYLLLLLVPMTGWLMSSASAYSVSWFNLLPLPDLVGPDEQLTEQLKTIHELLAQILFVIGVIHIAAALKHHLVDRDDVLQRMFSRSAAGVSVVLLAGGIWFSLPQQATDTSPAEVRAAPAETQAAALDTTLPLWSVDYTNSTIEFSAIQAGAPFSGRWLSWQAEIRFNPDSLAASNARVVFQLSDLSTNDTDRDNTIRGPEFFDVAQYPQAVFSATSFARTEEGFTAQGQLTIKGITLPLQFNFSITQQGPTMMLQGYSQIDRLAFNLGTGDWQDTSWVGQLVDVHVTLMTTD